MKTITIIIFLVFPAFVYGYTQQNDNALEKAWNSDQVACAVGKVYLRQNEYKVAEIKNMKRIPIEMSRALKPFRDQYQSALTEIFQDQSIFGDCSLAKLTDDLESSSTSENVEYYIIKRGKKMLPVLDLAIKYPVRDRSPEEEKFRLQFIQNIIKAINTGKILGMP